MLSCEGITKQVPIPQQIFKNPKYRGKHVVLLGTKVLASGAWEKVSKVFDETIKKSKKVPTLTYIPKEDALIL